MKKKRLQQNVKNLESWRVELAETDGPAGLQLLAELLNWHTDSVKPETFEESDNRRAVIERIRGELRSAHVREQLRQKKKVTKLRYPLDWRPRFFEIQGELKKDVLSILEPTPLSEDELAKEYVGMLPGIYKEFSPRENRFLLLWHKLRGFNWPMVGILIHGAGGSAVGMEGEFNIPTITFEINGEKVRHAEGPPRFTAGIKEHLYFILYRAIKIGEIAKLRICRYQPCRNFFMPKRSGRHCSEVCRTRDSNLERKKQGDFTTYYKLRRQQQIKRAKRLLERKKTIPDVLEQIPGLTYKALEKAGLIK